MDVTSDMLEAETRAVADDYIRRWGGGAALHGHCVEASLDLACRLRGLGVDGVIADGDYRTPSTGSGGAASLVTGHTWVEAGGLILDPTLGQFDVEGLNRLAIPTSAPDAGCYLRESAVSFDDEFGTPVLVLAR